MNCGNDVGFNLNRIRSVINRVSVMVKTHIIKMDVGIYQLHNIGKIGLFDHH
jgi:hypothetical protein